MAEVAGNMWQFNMVRVVVVDVTDDYALMQPPMPSDFYPVLNEIWLPRFGLSRKLAGEDLITGYQYDWHEGNDEAEDCWYVGVVREDLAQRLVEEVSDRPRSGNPALM